MNTVYRIVTDGMYFKVQVKRTLIYEIGKGNRQRAEDRTEWEDTRFQELTGVAFPPVHWCIDGKGFFDAEEGAEKAALKAWGVNGIRHREWRIV